MSLIQVMNNTGPKADPWGATLIEAECQDIDHDHLRPTAQPSFQYTQQSVYQA